LRLERRRVPVRGVPRGLDVVVGVQQHGRRSGRPRHLAEHGRVGLAVLQEPHALQAGGLHELGRLLGRGPDVRRVEPVGGHRRDTDQPLQVALDPGHVGRDALACVFDGFGHVQRLSWPQPAYFAASAKYLYSIPFASLTHRYSHASFAWKPSWSFALYSQVRFPEDSAGPNVKPALNTL